MQHAIINAIKCMRAIKDRIAKPVSQLAIISIEPLYHAQQVSRWKSSVRDLQVRQPITARWSSDTTNQSVTTPMIALDFSGTTNQLASHNVALKQHHSLRSEPCSSSKSLPKLETTRNAHPETQTSRRTNELLCTRTQQLRTSFPTLIQGFKWVAIERATLKESSVTKIAQIIGGERR
ncbi:hypothetical protein F511_39080 [Dorcoceras hygrometricum]|uniref:Uncharacterized protein n=1 Tax=Dorcoceras hygrometricum TaxID=472368 RepID=A0A2Z7CHK6_9LAMI|nr:hypothetical protein F511_39080 [Dorcoceras hygrometricum]